MMPGEPNEKHQPSVARVLLDSALPQLDHLFDYSIPDHLRADIRVGHRVKVPFRSRNRLTSGLVIELASSTDFSGTLSSISEIVSPLPLLDPHVWALARSVADRAAGNASDILRLAIPNRYVRVEKKYLASHQPEQEASTPHLTKPDEGERLQAQSLIDGERTSLRVGHAPTRLPDGEWVSAWAHLFARLAVAIQSLEHSVIIVVPDYRDLDQVHDSLTSLGVSDHVRLDARQAGGERYLNFLRALEPRPRIILGNRSAVYAPAHQLGAVLMWDDGDPTLAEPLTPYVHARDAALVRSGQSDAGLLFAAHSRSAEMQRLVNIGYLRPGEFTGAKPRIMHTSQALGQDPVAGRIPSLAINIIREYVAQGPVLVQVAMRGYAPTVVCSRCHDRVSCGECSGPVALSQNGNATCRWCGANAHGWRCATCGETGMQARGAGSERTAEQFQKMFPETRIIVSDGEHQRSRVDARPAVVVATRGAEPIAAGGYRAVVLLDVDSVLAAETLRAGEDAMRWWHNAIALAQTGAPCVVTGGGGPIVQAFVTGRTDEWLQRELQDRVQLRFPPSVRVASVTGAREIVSDALQSVQHLRSIDVLGPAPYGDATVRAIVRFGYDEGPEVAEQLRAALITNASDTQARARAAGAERPRRGAPRGALKLRFDDRGAFDDYGD